MGSKEAIRKAIDAHDIILAAHGPYTAKGAGDFLELNIDCISKNFSSFNGVVEALEQRISSY